MQRQLLLTIVGLSLIVAAILWGMSSLNAAMMNRVSTTFSNVLLFCFIVGFILVGWWRKINVYDAFVEGAKTGFTTAVSIVPYLVAILVAVGVFRASGAMTTLVDAIAWGVKQVGLDTQWVAALPTALMKPLSGSGLEV